MAEKWLVIDDSATIQRVIKLAFQDYDVMITEADSIGEALRELATTPASLVIVDAALAGVQSVQDFSRIHQSSPKSAFVILEGSYDHIDESQFRSAGFRHFLKKPFDAAQLIAITKEALGRSIPHRFLDEAPPIPRPFILPEEIRDHSPPPPPVARPYTEDVNIDNPFGTADSFDLGLGYKSEEQARLDIKAESPTPEPFALDHFSTEPFVNPDQFKAKPYNPDLNHDDDDSLPTPEPTPNPAALPTESSLGSSFSLDDDYMDTSRESSYIASPLSGMLEPMLQEEMAKLVRQSVEEYCRKHFAELAREFLLREIDKLSQERSRLLVDK
ncbi:MAG: response regulator [Proteobacteria bacterium]|nr:MAG: response regulator [Pseudomonadota bacterium]